MVVVVLEKVERGVQHTTEGGTRGTTEGGISGVVLSTESIGCDDRKSFGAWFIVQESRKSCVVVRRSCVVVCLKSNFSQLVVLCVGSWEFVVDYL